MEQLISHGMHECRSACHELVVVRILVFAPMSRCILARCGRLGHLSRVNKGRGRERTRRPALSTSVVQDGASARRRDACFTMRSLREVFGLWRVCFPPVLVRTARRLPVQGLSEGSLGFLDRLPAPRGPGTGLKFCHQGYQKSKRNLVYEIWSQQGFP